jgi:hypothetical protein
MLGVRFPSSLEASSLEGMLSSTVGLVLVLVGGTVEGEFSLDNSAMLRYLCHNPLASWR